MGDEYGKPLGYAIFVEDDGYSFGPIIDFNPANGEATVLTHVGAPDGTAEPVLTTEINRHVPPMKFNDHPVCLPVVGPNNECGIYMPSSDPQRFKMGLVMGKDANGIVTMRLQKATTLIVFDADIVTGNAIDGAVNSSGLTQVHFTIDNATTLGLIATQLATIPSIASAVSDGLHTITVENVIGMKNEFGGFMVNGGASQAGVTTSAIISTEDVQSPEIGESTVVSIPAYLPIPMPTSHLDDAINDYFKNNP